MMVVQFHNTIIPLSFGMDLWVIHSSPTTVGSTCLRRSKSKQFMLNISQILTSLGQATVTFIAMVVVVSSTPLTHWSHGPLGMIFSHTLLSSVWVRKFNPVSFNVFLDYLFVSHFFIVININMFIVFIPCLLSHWSTAVLFLASPGARVSAFSSWKGYLDILAVPDTMLFLFWWLLFLHFLVNPPFTAPMAFNCTFAFSGLCALSIV